jgi:ATP-dependent RNA helicase RhlE
MQSFRTNRSSSPRSSQPAGRPSAQNHSAKSGFAPRQGKPQQSGQRRGVVKQYIDPARFIREAIPVTAEAYAPVHSFSDFDLHANLKRNVAAKGYIDPTPIQDKTIPAILEGRDVVGIANTGTGKTAAFALPILDRLIHDQGSRLLVMAPTRELAGQILDECLAFARGCGLKAALLIGGASINNQKRDLRYDPRIVIGTPGRIKDHLSQGTLKLDRFNIVVLDEVDRMLDMGFIVPIRDILSRLPSARQSLFFSATMEPRIAKLIEGFAKAPLVVSVKTGITADGVSQDVVYYRVGDEKIDKLHDILIKAPGVKAIIFDDTKRDVEKLGRELHARGFKVDQLHGNKSQAQRSRALKRLKDGDISILVATDVAARGIDVADISHVINYSQPSTYDDYIHRIGRAGRAGKTGIALTFVAR